MKRDTQLPHHFDIIKITLDRAPFIFYKDINGVYQGGNLNQARTCGFYNPSGFIGKTIFDILEDKEAAKLIDQTDREVMQKGVPFQQAELQQINREEKSMFYLLSDHELINQKMHGLEIIAQAKLSNATLVTSHYINPHVLTHSNELHIPVLPKRLSSKVPIQIIPAKMPLNDPPALKKTDIILLDDSQVFADSIIFRLSHRNVTHYLDPRIFIDECELYAKDTPVCIDNHFDVEVDIGGVEVAAQLHARGFTRLYIVSGAYFAPDALPKYVTLIKKMNLDMLDLL